MLQKSDKCNVTENTWKGELSTNEVLLPLNSLILLEYLKRHNLLLEIPLHDNPEGANQFFYENEKKVTAHTQLTLYVVHNVKNTLPDHYMHIICTIYIK